MGQSREEYLSRWRGLVSDQVASGKSVAAFCREHGLRVWQFYEWKKRLLGSATQVFDEKPKKHDADRERLERELTRMKGVVAEITAENLELKKTLSG